MMQFGIFSPPSLRMLGFMFHLSKLMYLDTTSSIIATMSGYCAYNKWYWHFCKCNHCWFNLCRFYFTSCFFFEEWLWQLQLRQRLCHIVTDTLMFTLACWWFPSSLCQHSMVGKVLWRSSSFDFTSFYKQKVIMIFQKI